MESIRVLVASIALAGAPAATAAAQTVTVYKTDSARASVKVGYGGHGIDWETSVDSPMILDLVRIRGGIARGNWVGWDTTFPPAGSDPTVTRVAASVIIGGRFPPAHGLPSPDYVRWYFGAGIAAYVPHRRDMNAQRGTHLVFGVDVSGERWTIGPELDFDFPRDNDPPRPFFNDDLLPTVRIGLAVRRHF
jgi:hypothetical protein